jgi:hypothetical protein
MDKKFASEDEQMSLQEIILSVVSRFTDETTLAHKET